MDWIKLPVRIRDDPRVGILATKLGIPYNEALGLLVSAMAWCGDHETRLLPESLEGVTRQALRDAGLLGAEGLADFEFTSSSLIASRESNRLRQQRHRSKMKQLKGSVTVTSREPKLLCNGLDLDLEGEVDLEGDLEKKKKKPSPPLSPSRVGAKRWKVVPAEHRTMTEAQRAYAERYGVTLDEWAGFIDHQFKTSKLDVNATWESWVRTAASRRVPKPASAPVAVHPQRLAGLAFHSRDRHPGEYDPCAHHQCRFYQREEARGKTANPGA